MADYRAVQETLAGRGDPAMLCATCPWDRNCVNPPTMTRAEIDAKLADAGRLDDERSALSRLSGSAPPMPVSSLITAATLGDRDTAAQVCPVLALRLRSGQGRDIAAALRAQMQGWDDQR
jgi:hypothetical protein